MSHAFNGTQQITARPPCSSRNPTLSDPSVFSQTPPPLSPSEPNSPVQTPSSSIARSHSDPLPGESRATNMKLKACVKSCLKTSRATRHQRPDAPHRSVSFRERDSDEVYVADDWDRSPVDLTPKLTYDDILELKELQISTARANASAVSQNARRLGLPVPQPKLCARVPVGLLPLLPESPSPSVNSPISPDSSYEFNKPLSPPNTPPRRIYSYIPPPDPPVKRAFVFVPLLDNSTSPAPTPTPSACPSPRLQPTSAPSSPPVKHFFPAPSSVKMAFPPSPPAEQQKTPESYFQSHFVGAGPSSLSSSSSPRKGTPSSPPTSSPQAPMRKFRLPTMPLLPPQASPTSTPPSPQSRYPSSPASPPSPRLSRSDRPNSPTVNSSSPRPSSPRTRTPQRSNFVGVGLVMS